MSAEPQARGTIELSSIGKVLKDLFQRKASGELTATVGGTTKKVYLKNGLIVYCNSNLEKDRLGNILLDHKMISTEQYEESARQVIDSGKKQGTVLVQMGALSPKNLFQGLNLQVREIVLSLFTWDNGTYVFEDRLPEQEEIITLRIHPAPIIVEGIVERAAKKDHFRSFWDVSTLQIAPYPDPPWIVDDLRLSQEAKKIHALIEKNTPWEEIPALAGVDEEKAAALLYALSVLELAAAAPPVAAEEAAAAEEEVLPGEEAPKPAEVPEKWEKVTELHGKLNSSTLYQVLGLEPNASTDAIKNSYLTMAKDYHPDRFYGEGTEVIRDQLNAIFMKINEAYTVLSNARKRQEYDRKEIRIEAAAKTKVKDEHDPLIARQQYQKGMMSLKGGDFWSAIESFRWAVNLNPQNPTYHTWLGAALTMTKQRLHEAEEHCKTAIALDYSNPLYYVHLGKVYKTGRLFKKARQQFEAALKLKPDYGQAQKEIEELE